MIPTIFGGIVLLIGGYIVLWGTIDAALALTLITTLFGGSAALLLPALGGSSVPPSIVATIVLGGKIAYDRALVRREIEQTLHDSGFIIFFMLYSAIAALLLPFVFARTMMVAPLRPLDEGGLFAVAPLQFTNQNITTIVYLIFTCAAIMMAALVARAGLTVDRLVKITLFLVAFHVGFGWYDVATRGTPAFIVIDALRNAQYAMLDQGAGAIPRMAGIFPETSAFANYGFALFILTFELWVRRIWPRAMGIAALISLFTLIVSTSSSAYIAIGAYATILVVRFVYFRQRLGKSNQLAIFMAIVIAATVMLALVVFLPAVATGLTDKLNEMTTAKIGSESGVQRSFWAWQGVEAFKRSWGLGVGPGSFRSSSFATAMIGSVGIPGTALFLGILGLVIRSIVRCSCREHQSSEAAMGSALGWASLVMLIPAATGAASLDPGLSWGLTAGLALGFAARVDARSRLARTDRITDRRSPTMQESAT